MTSVDRLIELDVDALGGAGSPSRVEAVVRRLLPLWRDAAESGGEAGLVLNLGWLMDPVMLFEGTPEQKLPIRSARLGRYAEMTYAELGGLVSDIRESASTYGLSGLRVGMLFLGIGEFVNEIVRAPGTGTEQTREAAIYRESGEWFHRHPELFPFSATVTLHGPGVDWRIPLAADERSYASRPHGIAAGDSFAEFLAEQWAAVTDTVGFDLLLLRDETTTPVHAGRMAFDGTSTPATAAEIDEWTNALVAVTSSIKRAAPSTLLVLYSSGLSPTVELRYGRLDIARVVAEGGIDAWVDQTWGGAWQDWWDAGWQGWSFQLTNLLARAALITAGNATRTRPCRHYPLIQLLDGWEPYDTLHDYPNKLHWGIWAFSHASTRNGGEESVSGGMYLAVGNDRTGALIPDDDVAWIADALSAATESARQLERTVGPALLVPDRDSAVRASMTAESVEDATGFLGKWGIPVLSSATGSRPAEADSRGVILAAAAARSLDEFSLVVGAPEDLLPSVASEVGVCVGVEVAPSGYRRGMAVAATLGIKPAAWPYMGRRHKTRATAEGVVLYDGEDGPTAVRRSTRLWWLPPHVANGADRRLTHYQLGTVDPHIVVARALGEFAAEAGQLWLDGRDAHETISLHGWVSAGVMHLLLGNLESGWIGDSRFRRTVTVHLPRDAIAGLAAPVALLRDGSWRPVLDDTVVIDVQPEGFELARIVELSILSSSHP